MVLVYLSGTKDMRGMWGYREVRPSPSDLPVRVSLAGGPQGIPVHEWGGGAVEASSPGTEGMRSMRICVGGPHDTAVRAARLTPDEESAQGARSCARAFGASGRLSRPTGTAVE